MEGLLHAWKENPGIFCGDKESKEIISHLQLQLNDKIVVISTEGTVSTLKINRKKMDILSTTELNDLTHNTPAVAKEKIFFRTNSKLFCLPLNKEQL